MFISRPYNSSCGKEFAVNISVSYSTWNFINLCCVAMSADILKRELVKTWTTCKARYVWLNLMEILLLQVHFFFCHLVVKSFLCLSSVTVCYPATVSSNVSAVRLKGSLFPLTLPLPLCSSGCFSKLSLAQAWISGAQKVSPGNRTPPGKWEQRETERHSEAKQTQISGGLFKISLSYINSSATG